MSLLLYDLSLDTITNPLNMSQSLDKHESMQSLKLTSHDSADAFYALYPLYYLDNQLVSHPSVGYDAHKLFSASPEEQTRTVTRLVDDLTRPLNLIMLFLTSLQI